MRFELNIGLTHTKSPPKGGDFEHDWATLACFVGIGVVASGGGEKTVKDRKTDSESDAKVARLKARLNEQRRVVD